MPNINETALVTFEFWGVMLIKLHSCSWQLYGKQELQIKIEISVSSLARYNFLVYTVSIAEQSLPSKIISSFSIQFFLHLNFSNINQ